MILVARVMAPVNWNSGFLGAIVVPILAAVIAAAVVVAGYLYDRQNRRRDDLRALFSDALAAVAEYQELPYRIRRRSDTSPMTSSDIAAHASDVQLKLDHFVARLRLESFELGECFDRLVRASRQEAGAHMSAAWKEPRIEADADMPLGARYSRDNGDAAMSECIKAMQGYLGVKTARS